MPLSSQSKVLLVATVPACTVGYLLHRYWDAGGSGGPLPPRDPRLGAVPASTQWAARAAAANMAPPPSSILERGSATGPKAFTVMTEKSAAQKERYELRHPHHPHTAVPSWTPPTLPLSPPTSDAGIEKSLAVVAAAPELVRLPILPSDAGIIEKSLAAAAAAPELVRSLLLGDGAAHHQYPLPSGLTVHQALDVLVHDVSRHAELVTFEVSHVTLQEKTGSAALFEK